MSMVDSVRAASTTMRSLFLVACALACSSVMHVAFTALPTLGAERAGQLTVHPGRSAAAPPAARVADDIKLSSQSSSAVVAVGLAALAVAAARHRRRSVVARRVTLDEIDQLSVTDVPFGWRPKISLAIAKKANLVKAIKKTLNKTYFVMVFNKDGMDTASIEEARATFPPGATVRCLKNALVRKAMEGSEWEPFCEHIRGSNMFVFAEADSDIKPCIEAFQKMDKKNGRAARLEQLMENRGPVGFDLRPLVGGIIRDEWDFIGPEKFDQLKNMPTRLELIAQIAGGIQQVPQKLAKGIKLGAGWKLAVGIKKITEKMEEEGKDTVADVAV